MKPHVICHMTTSLDGGLHPSKFSKSPDGTRAAWSKMYESIHDSLYGDAWLVGRVTMAEMSKAEAHPPASPGPVRRPINVAAPEADSYAIAVDPSGRLHFNGPDIGGDHVIVLLGSEVPETHLAELMADGVSYIVAKTEKPDLAEMLDLLGRDFGIRRVLLEGGAVINGAFLAAGLVDELSLLIAPGIDGRMGAESFVEFGEEGLADKVQLSLKSCEAVEHGLVHLRYAVSR